MHNGTSGIQKLLAVFFLPLLSLAGDHRQPDLTIQAVAYRVIPHERVGYYTVPGHSTSTCYGAGAVMGDNASWNASCYGSTTPAQTYPIRAQWVEVFNQVTANGNVYLLYCKASWRGSNCLHMNPGDTFPARVEGTTMWIYARKGGNLGKQVESKMRMLDMRPATEASRAPMPQ